MIRFRALVSLVALLGGLVAALAVLRAMATEPWIPGPRQILSAAPEEAVAGLIWIAATGVTVWLLVTTLASLLAHASRLPSAIRAVDVWTLPAIRSLARRATAASMVATSIMSPLTAAASDAPPIPVVVVADESAEEDAETPEVPITPPVAFPAEPTPERIEPKELPVTAVPEMTVTASHTVVATAPSIYTVMPGDSMWTITANHLTSSLGARPSNTDISVAWRQMIELNEHRVRSGDVNLIFPGEVLVLPDAGSR